jgi:hypothetical protein
VGHSWADFIKPYGLILSTADGRHSGLDKWVVVCARAEVDDDTDSYLGMLCMIAWGRRIWSGHRLNTMFFDPYEGLQ